MVPIIRKFQSQTLVEINKISVYGFFTKVSSRFKSKSGEMGISSLQFESRRGFCVCLRYEVIILTMVG